MNITKRNEIFSVKMQEKRNFEKHIWQNTVDMETLNSLEQGIHTKLSPVKFQEKVTKFVGVFFIINNVINLSSHSNVKCVIQILNIIVKPLNSARVL